MQDLDYDTLCFCDRRGAWYESGGDSHIIWPKPPFVKPELIDLILWRIDELQGLVSLTLKRGPSKDDRELASGSPRDQRQSLSQIDLEAVWAIL